MGAIASFLESIVLKSLLVIYNSVITDNNYILLHERYS